MYIFTYKEFKIGSKGELERTKWKTSRLGNRV